MHLCKAAFKPPRLHASFNACQTHSRCSTPCAQAKAHHDFRKHIALLCPPKLLTCPNSYTLVKTLPAGQTAKFMGIRNGIDPDLWSPSDNRYLPMAFSANNMEEGKKR